MLDIKILAGCRIICDGGLRLSKQIRHDGIKGNIADSKGILETILRTVFYGIKLIAITGELPQDADVFRQNKAAFDRTDTEKAIDPLGGLGVVLVPLHRFYPFWIGDYHTDTALFKDVENRNSVFPSRFHADIQAHIL